MNITGYSIYNKIYVIDTQNKISQKAAIKYSCIISS